MKIPIARPSLGKPEAAAAAEAVLSGWVTQGPRVEQFEKDFASYAGAEHACAVSSCTTALHLALIAVGVKPGDVVITVSHSFIATANSVRYCMAEPVFVDIDSCTFNMSPESLERCLRRDCIPRGGSLYYKKVSKVAAIMPVHQMGMPADMRSILAIARRYGIPVVEDAACAIGSEIAIKGGSARERIGRPHGDVACFSFHPRKILTTGDGGMLTTCSAKHDRLFRLLRQHGMSVSDRKRHIAAKVSFESYLMTGYNYRMTDIQAAVGIEQLKRIDVMIAGRRRLASVYEKELSDVPWLRLPTEPAYCRTNYQSYPVTVLKGAPRSRDSLMQRLLDRGVSTRRGIMNAHQEAPYRAHREDLKMSERARDSVILLPVFHGLKEVEIRKIAEIIKDA
ncbi:MAG: DegT/DnrJ/EryC1/StrS family aminotransferase [Candidatus Omnitrophica bacterium]|nr:DegT/DnrJ/EryC1/StrS family aminotransferase [Candidatus Omnitrophota bacterium]